jgi:hypothetical protein
MLSPLWILASAVALTLGALALFGMGDAGGQALILGGPVYGILSAAALWWLTR